MDPRYMDNCEFDTLSIAPLQQKRGHCRIKASPDLLRPVKLLGTRARLGGGGQFDRLSLKPNETKHLGFCGRCQVGSL